VAGPALYPLFLVVITVDEVGDPHVAKAVWGHAMNADIGAVFPQVVVLQLRLVVREEHIRPFDTVLIFPFVDGCILQD
jgi:hypothetical protein